jgi:CHRD domain
VLAALETGRTYVNVHTPRNAAGEIRGQIRAVPLSIS